MESGTLSWLSGGLAVLLALVHIHAGKLKFLDRKPRSGWLSFASGVSVSYVFVHLLPELSEHQDILSQLPLLSFLERHVYVFALLGLIVFYGLERAVCLSQQGREQLAAANAPMEASLGNEHTLDPAIFWLHISSFMAYNALIGYLLAQAEAPNMDNLLLYTLAMALHFIVNDNALREAHRTTYHQQGRWLLAGAIIAGWLIGYATVISEAVLASLLAFLAGSIVLNVIKEELPEQQQSRFGAFLLGAMGYTLLLLAI